MPRYKVTLTEEERRMLEEITTRGKHSSQTVLNALILLGCDEGRFQEKKKTGQQLANVLPVSLKKVDRVKRRFVEDGLDVALEKRKPDRQYAKKADGDFEAHLAVPGPVDRHAGGDAARSPGLGPAEGHREIPHRLALHHRRRQDQAEATLPDT